VRYALFIYEAPGAYDGLSEAECAAITREYLAVHDDRRVVGGAKLGPVDATSTVRVASGETLVTDGPFADTKEVFGGYYLLEADDLDGALEIASRIPAARMGGAVEVRPEVTSPQ
jgi:hypothetical protein